jgi:DNA-binding response OmpR family regulator
MSYNVLVVEDYKVTRMMIKKMLEKGTDWKISEAQDGQIAIEFLQSQNPDLIILDLMMPKMNGFEFLKKIKSMPNVDKIPVLILTGLKSIEDEMKGLHEGADDYLTKPIKMDTLISRCKNLLNAN